MKIRNSDFVHLHNHSEYSSFDGLAAIKAMIRKARSLGFPALALTDHGNIGGLIEFMKECTATKTKKGDAYGFPTIKPIVGIEAYVSKSRHNKSIAEQPQGRRGNHHLVLLAKNWKGYQNLCTLCNRGWLEGFYHSPRIDLELISEFSEGLICSSACVSSFINANLIYDRYDEAKKSASALKDIFGADFFLEVMYHGLNIEEMYIPEVFKLSKELDIPMVATNDNHYIDKDQAESQRLFMAMQSGGSRCIHDPTSYKQPYSEFYMKDAAEMAQVWKTNPELLLNTVAVAERVDHADIAANLFGGFRQPNFRPPLEYMHMYDEDEKCRFTRNYSFMKKLVAEGLKKHKWEQSEKHKAALAKELKDVEAAWEANDADFATYFCIVWDYIREANERGILVGCGRGSGPASVILRCLDITYGPDPIEKGLIWERFLGFKNSQFIKPSDFGLIESVS